MNPDLTQPASKTLPDLRLQSSSEAIDRGTHLTATVGTGSNSSSLVVADAMYFQDGTWGSDLARGVTLFPDWISIGTVTNGVQISRIDYSSNTITLASSMTWSNGARIWLYKNSKGVGVLSGAAPDMGAYEYDPANPIPTPTMSTPVPAMAEWGMILLAVLLGIGSVYYLKKRGLVIQE